MFYIVLKNIDFEKYIKIENIGDKLKPKVKNGKFSKVQN
jgi:hypothetical protein